MTGLFVIGYALGCALAALGGVAAIGFALLTPAEEREAIATAKVWAEKRRALNESIEARSIK